MTKQVGLTRNKGQLRYLSLMFLTGTLVVAGANPVYAQTAGNAQPAAEDAANAAESEADAAKNDAQAAAPKSSSQSQPALEEVIVVSSIRRSLISALDEKMTSDNIKEVIQAEDIGKLPDQNLAEVLENIPGVQITREAGVGRGVQIRGTDDNRVEINGVSTVSSGADRSGIAFDDVPASMIASVEVIKVPEAATVEGSVGGTINLRTIRPLDLTEPLLAGRVQYESSDLADDTYPRVSGTAGSKWETDMGTFAAVISGSYSEQSVAAFRPRVDRDALVMPGSGPSAEAFPYLRIQFFDQELENFEYETQNYTGSFEWQPNDELKFYFDATLNDQQRAQESTRVQISGVSAGPVVNTANNTSFETINWGTLDGPNGPINLGSVQAALTGTLGIGVAGNGVIDPNLRTSSNTGARDTDSEIFALGTVWDATDRLTVAAEESISTSSSEFPNLSITMDFINPFGPQPAFGRSLDNGVPTIFDLRGGILQFGIDEGSEFAPTSAQLLDPANYQLQQVTQGDNQTDNEEKAVRFDFSYDSVDQIPFILGFDAGYRYNKNSAENNVFSNNVTLSNATTHWNRPEGNLFADVLIAGPNNFNDADNRYLYFPDFLVVNGALSYSNPAQVLDVLNGAIAASNASATQGPPIGSLVVPTESAAGFFNIKEETNAAYFQANFGHDFDQTTVRGNIGVRYVSTDVSSIGNTITGGNVEQTVTKSSYDFFLPRFNLVIQPTDEFIIRAGIAQDIRRPDFNQLSTSVSFGTSPNEVVPVGNPELEPEDVWSYDLAFEYYFSEASLFSIGFFHKDRGNLFAAQQEDPAPNLVNGQLNIDITPPCEEGGIYNPIAQRNINNPIQGIGICVPFSTTFNVGGSTTQSGVEVIFQSDLSPWEDKLGWASGFGFIGNYTWQETDASDPEFRAADGPRSIFTLLGYPNSQDRITLSNFSENAYNITLFYDKYGWNARVRYTWRSEYVSEDTFFFGLPRINGERGQLNASINYSFNEHFTAGIEGVNLTREDANQYCVNANTLLCFQGLTDRRLTAGVSMRF